LKSTKNLWSSPRALAFGAEKRAALSLDDPLNHPFFAGRTLLALPRVDPVMMLVAPFAIDSISVGTVLECGPLGSDRFEEYFLSIIE
jgi:hypothetical protein